jgi:hypothetical protein
MAFLLMFLIKHQCIRRANPPISLHAPGSLRSLPAKQSGAAGGLGTLFLDGQLLAKRELDDGLILSTSE